MIKVHQHSLITIAIMLLSLLLVVELYVGLLLIGFWSGREHSQAEYRYMKLKGINRSELGEFDGLRRDAWNVDSLVNALLLPTMIAIFIIIIGGMIW